MQAINRVVKNTGILYARMAITVGISLYSTRLILNALGAEDFGLFNLVGGAIAMLGFLNGSMAAATQRFISFSQGAGDFEKVKRIFNMSILLHVGVAILAVILLEIAGYFFFHSVFNISPDRVGVGKLIYQFMVASTFVTILSVPYEAVITSHENMLFFAIISILEAVLKLAIAFYITYAIADHLYLYGLLTALLSVLLLIIRRIYCNRKYPECVINVKQHLDKPLLKEMTGFAGWSFLGYSTSMISFYGQSVVLNYFFGTIVNAAQGITNQVSGQISSLSTVFIKAVNPLIDKSEGGNNRALMLNVVSVTTKTSFFLLTFIYIPFIIEMPFILKIWLKEVPNYTIIFCRLLLIKNLIEQLYVPLGLAIKAHGDIKNFELRVSLILLSPIFLSIIFFLLKAPPYIVYLIFIMNSILILLISIFYAKSKLSLKIDVFFNEIVLRCIVTTLLIFLISSIPSLYFIPSLIRLVTTLCISIIVFVISGFFIGLNKYDKIEISNFLKK